MDKLGKNEWEQWMLSTKKRLPYYCKFCQKKILKAPFYYCKQFGLVHCKDCVTGDWGICGTINYHEHTYIQVVEVEGV